MKKIILPIIIVFTLLLGASFAYSSDITPQWYLKHRYTNQDSTAYVAPTGARTASGKIAAVGMVAVHAHNNDPTRPFIPFGTMIHMESPSYITIQGNNYSYFYVEDVGDYARKWSNNWIDIFFGVNNPTNTDAAIWYGVKKVTYYWNEWIN